jgi:hypothetical protein
MSERAVDLLVIFGIIATMFAFLVAVAWWTDRGRARRYWGRFGPVACPGCGTKYKSESDQGERDIDGPAPFSGHLFECPKCLRVAGFEPSEGPWKDAEFVGYLKDGFIE